MGILAMVSALAIGLILGRFAPWPKPVPAPETVADRVTVAHPGPWGRLEYVPISIECPEELLPMEAFKTKVTHWILPRFTMEKFFQLLEGTGVTDDLREALQSPEVLHVSEGGLDLTPTPGIIFNLPPEARKKLYAILARFSENGSALIFVQTKTLEERFAGSGVSPSTVELFRKLSCESGQYLVFSDVPSLFARIPTYAERLHLLKALTRQQTMLVRLHLTADANIEELMHYWGKIRWAKDTRPLLESLARIPGGARLDIAHLMPPTAAGLLYSFPLPANPLDGAPVKKDCHYTAFNFFHDPPDPRYADPAFIMSRLEEEYSPVSGDPRYGDLALLVTPDGQLIHSAVYLADNIVYTKNGDTMLHPWMLSTVQDLIDQYSFQVPQNQALEVKFYRNKNY